jgi:hypothetical protein
MKEQIYNINRFDQLDVLLTALLDPIAEPADLFRPEQTTQTNKCHTIGIDGVRLFTTNQARQAVCRALAL